MALEFHIESGSSIPIYRQIEDQVRRAVATGALKQGDSIPSIRALAEQLVINPNTVARAYGDLVREGTLISQHGKSLVVAEKRQIFSKEERERRLAEAVEVFINEILFLDFSPTQVRRLLDKKLSEIQTPEKKGDFHE
jgi:GntR family transcriptional regulator